jgi:hypothetical protein
MTGTGSARIVLISYPITRGQYDAFNNFVSNTLIPNLSGSGIPMISQPQYTETI